MARMFRVRTLALGLMLFAVLPVRAENETGLGVDLDFYTGRISPEVWSQMKEAGHKFAVVQAWGGRSRNEFAVSQLSGARLRGRMSTAAYILLNFDDQVCRTYARPVRETGGKCAGSPMSQPKPGGRWQVRQGIVALGSELKYTAFIAIDVEWFLSSAPPSDARTQASRRQRILEAIDEVKRYGKRTVIYTRNSKLHWHDITGCDPDSTHAQCKALSAVINDPVRPIPLWDVEKGEPELDNFVPYAAWTERAGRQYQLDTNVFGLPAGRTIDLNVFSSSLFTPQPVKKPRRRARS